MAITQKQAAEKRLLDAYRNGLPPDPADIALADRSDKGGTPLRGMDYDKFHKTINYAFAYLVSRAQGKSKADSLNAANIGMETEDQKAGIKPKEHITEKCLDAYCKYLRYGEPPTDPRAKWHLEHTRAALRQIDITAGKNPQKQQKINKDYDYPMEQPKSKPDRVNFPK